MRLARCSGALLSRRIRKGGDAYETRCSFFGSSGKCIGGPDKSGPWSCLERKIVWAEAQIWAAGGKFVPLGPRTIFLGRPKRRMHLPISRMYRKSREKTHKCLTIP